MDNEAFSRALAGLPLGELLFFQKISSTNDVALTLAASGCPDMSLVYGEEQLSGRGRKNRKWYSTRASSLTFSLVIRPSVLEKASIPLFTGLGAVAVCEAVMTIGLSPSIKWPNDLLIEGKKFCGILTESTWSGDQLNHIVLGVGVNITLDAIPSSTSLEFPATCLEFESGKRVNRSSLLREIIRGIIAWRKCIGNETFLQTWEDHLAYRGKDVELSIDKQKLLSGRLDGLEKDGSLRIVLPNQELTKVIFGEVKLRPVV